MTGTCQGAGGGGPGVSYSYAELEGLWTQAGGSPALAPVMAAIAMAESGGCSTALNPTDNGGTQTSWGLWQISNGTHSPPGPNPLTGPGSAALAVAKQHSQGLQAWGTYNSGAYRQFLNGSVPPAAVAGGGGAVLTAAGGGDPTCLIAAPKTNLFFGFGPGISPGCLVSKSQGRAVAGFSLMMIGGAVGLVGSLILVAYGLRSAGAGRAAGRGLELGGSVLSAVAPEAGVPLARAGSAVRSQGAVRGGAGLARQRGERQLAERSAAGQARDRRQAEARRGRGPARPRRPSART